MGYVYKIINDVNNKIYIGKTELSNPEKRWKEHLSDYKRKRCEKRPLYSAMNKYGEEHFHFEVIEEVDNPEEREKYWIKKLRTYIGFDDCNGYNATLGGDGKAYLNLNKDEVIKYHIDEANYMIARTSNHFNVDFGTMKNFLNKNHITYLNNKDFKSLIVYEDYGGVFQIDKNTKLILNVFENAILASEYINGNEKTMRSVCSGCHGRHYAYGYLWYYGKDIPEAIKNGEIVEADKIGQKYYEQCL